MIPSTRLRKYVATVSQILDLQDNGLDWLACHLGHDISVHREYYRLHESTIELAKVGKILTRVDERKTRLRAGKPLNDIDLDKDIRDLKIPRFQCTGTGKLPVAVHVISGGKF